MLLSLLMLFSLTACGEDSGGGGGGNTAPPEGYDAEYTIVIDGSDSWTPFSDGSSITFETAESGVISTSNDGKTVTFTGLAVGETTITATYGDKTAKALVKVVKRTEEKTISVDFSVVDEVFGKDGQTTQYLLRLEPESGDRNIGLMTDELVITPEGAIGEYIVQYVDREAYTHVLVLGLTPTEVQTITISFDKKGYAFSPSSAEITIHPPGDW